MIRYIVDFVKNASISGELLFLPCLSNRFLKFAFNIFGLLKEADGA